MSTTNDIVCRLINEGNLPRPEDTTQPWNYEVAIARIEIEFHLWVDEWEVPEEALHAGWVAGMLRRWYPAVRKETIAELINRWGWF